MENFWKQIHAETHFVKNQESTLKATFPQGHPPKADMGYYFKTRQKYQSGGYFCTSGETAKIGKK